jgi:uncharacterized repeat protein (TIGR03843 family)
MNLQPAHAGGVENLLITGNIEVLGLIPYSSNYTFLARVTGDKDEALAVYKPRRGERPLWDFPHGTLAAREVAAYLVSEAAGWRFVPTTVLREEAPLGGGSLQLFIEHDPERHFFVLVEERPEDLRTFAAFDAVINNADRKGGHVLEGKDGRLWAVDHGVSFHVEPKLRTVIWEFSEDALGDEIESSLGTLERGLVGGLERTLAELLSPAEAAATTERVRALRASGHYPPPTGDRPLPWPLV